MITRNPNDGMENNLIITDYSGISVRELVKALNLLPQDDKISFVESETDKETKSQVAVSLEILHTCVPVDPCEPAVRSFYMHKGFRDMALEKFGV